MLRLAAKKLDAVGVAVQEQGNQFVETVNRRVRCGIHNLFKRSETQSENIRAAVKGAAADIHIGTFHVGSVSIAPSERQENDSLSEMLIFPQKTILRLSCHCSQFYCRHSVSFPIPFM